MFPQYLDLDEVSMVTGLMENGRTLPQTLAAKSSDGHYANLNMKVFLAHWPDAKGRLVNSFVRKSFEGAYESARKRLFRG